ncbi:MAG TPA: lamin tail domain-containing protein, partial [Anaerolineales bacterium]|nr:lamin tail domain-containing protein [Anaerolineales bacterium]
MEHSKGLWRGLFLILLITALCGGLALPIVSAPAYAAPQMQTVAHLVISQVYGGGGNSGAPYNNDYVELFNPTNASVSVNGWSIQYASATGTGLFSADVIPLSGSISSGQYYLVQLGPTGSTGNALPAPDATDTTGATNIAASNGKIVLVNTTTGLACNGGSTPCNPSDLASIIDLVGYGSANFFEGSKAAPRPPNNSTAVIRSFNGCNDTNDNSVDFATGAPKPRNSQFGPISTCSSLLTATASAANLTATASAANLTATASAVNLTNTAAALTTG